MLTNVIEVTIKPKENRRIETQIRMNTKKVWHNNYSRIIFLSKKYVLLFILLIAVIQGQAFAALRISSSIIKTTADGLCNSMVTSIAQDKFGFMWIGTEEGLSKYDGLRFKTFKIDSSDSTKLTNNSIVSLIATNNGDIWVGTYEGCQVYNDELNRFVTIDFRLKSIQNKAVKIEKIFQDSKNNIWLSTSIHGVVMINQNNGPNIHLFNEPGNPLSICSNIITDITEDAYGNIWFSSSDYGISVFNANSSTMHHYNSENGTLPGNRVLRMVKASNNSMYVSILKLGLVRFDPQSNSFIPVSQVNKLIPSKIIFSFNEDSQNNLLLGTDGDGLVVYNTTNDIAYYHPVFNERFYELRKSRVHSIYVDRQKNIWLGIPTLGFCLIKESNSGFQTYRNFDDTPFHDCINGIFVDNKQTIYLASDGGGLFVFNRSNNIKKQFKHNEKDNLSLPDNAALCVFVDNSSNTWVGTYTGGISMMKGVTGKFSTFNTTTTKGELKSNNIRSIAQSKDGAIWFATHGGGISRYDNNDKSFKTFLHSKSSNSLINDWANILHFDNNNKLWIGTVYGLSCFDMSKKSFTNYSTLTHVNMRNNMIHAISSDNKGKIWFGTDNGLHCLNPKNNTIEVFTTDNDLLSNRIKGLVFTGSSSLWLSDNQGITCFDTESHNVRTFNQQDGLQSEEFNSGSYFLSKQGEVLFGGTKGINIFKYNMITPSTHTQTIILTDLQLYDQQVLVNKRINGRIILPKALKYMKQIELNYSDKSITVEFSTPEYFAGKKLIVSSYLNGFDNKWRNLPAGERSVTYTNLTPGKYTLHLKSGQANGVLDSKETRIIIRVRPPFWKSWWAYFAYVILIVGAVVYSIRLSKRKNLQKDKERVIALETKKQEEVYMSKLVFFTNISHEFRTPLTLITSPLERLIVNENNAERLQLLNIIHKNAQRLLHLINQILDLRKIDMNQMKVKARKIVLGDVVNDIIYSFSDLANQKNIELNFENRVDKLNVLFDPDMLDKCIYNIMSNAIKYTSKGYVAVTLDTTTDNDIDYAVIRVADTGIGISKDNMSRLFDRYYQCSDNNNQNMGSGIGLNLVKSIIELHNGQVKVKSELNEGSVFSLYIRIDNPELEQTAQTEINLLPDMPATHFISEDASLPEVEDESAKPNNAPLILIVDDNTDMRLLLRVELCADFKVIEAVDGENALEKIKNKQPDLIITDIMMPVMDGIRLCKALKSNFETSHIPIIVLTAKSGVDDQIEGLNTGIDAYVTKPFNMNLLKSHVRNILLQRQKLKSRFSHSINWEIESGVLTSADERLMECVFDIIKRNIESPGLSVEKISKEMKISRAQLHRKVKGIIGQTPVELIRTIRMNQAAKLLNTTNLTVSEVAYAVGFNSQSYFSSSFSEFFGKTPTQFVKKNV